MRCEFDGGAWPWRVANSAIDTKAANIAGTDDHGWRFMGVAPSGRPKGRPLPNQLPKGRPDYRINASTYIKRVLIQLDARLLPVHVDGDDIESTRTLDQIVPCHIVQRHTCHAPPFERRDRLRACTELAPFARLDLDEHHDLPVARNDVQFSTPAPVTAGKNCVPAALELLAGEIFAEFPQRLSGL